MNIKYGRDAELHIEKMSGEGAVHSPGASARAAKKIAKAKDTKISDDFLIIARIESFILGISLSDALKRAEAYSKAGADAILIHSKEKNPSQIFSFAKKFTKSKFFI